MRDLNSVLVGVDIEKVCLVCLEKMWIFPNFVMLIEMYWKTKNHISLMGGITAQYVKPKRGAR